MNETLLVENIKKHFEELGKPVTSNFIYGYVNPSIISSIFMRAFAIVEQEYYIIAFYPDELVLTSLTVMSNYKDEQLVIPRAQIQRLSVRKGLLQYIIKIKTADKKIKLNCNKSLITIPWQKENIDFLEKNNWYKEELTS